MGFYKYFWISKGCKRKPSHLHAGMGFAASRKRNTSTRQELGNPFMSQCLLMDSLLGLEDRWLPVLIE